MGLSWAWGKPNTSVVEIITCGGRVVWREVGVGQAEDFRHGGHHVVLREAFGAAPLEHAPHAAVLRTRGVTCIMY